MGRIGPMGTIARLTFIEAVRKKVFLLSLLLALLFLGLYVLGMDFAAQEIQRVRALHGRPPLLGQMIGRQLLAMGLHFASFLLAMLLLVTSVGAIMGELENGLMHAVASKPLARSQIMLGKFVGFGAMTAIYGTVLFGAVLAVNGIYNQVSLEGLSLASLVGAWAVFLLQPLVLLAIVLLAGTWLKTVAAGVVAMTFYVLAGVGGFLEQVGGLLSKPLMVQIGIAVSLVMPTDALYRKLMAMVTTSDVSPASTMSMGPLSMGAPPSDLMVLYAGGYVVAFLLLALWRFERMDL
ncbi:ABC transporter permease subunit [Heliophilum fasciatum]|uniref:ABC-type transport system involved in multi-copper enzyme maturation permease subunit n=1 Tax=Heliophilum fasciatum TaxID=35700 RepID=A0A4R2RW39_9FIRM|nr:ABC transporter permease subunit [Heliophilum fasciatum]MCW2278101.1 ABC-type transport system involved in multi-copper enzyme maturation permease subunit [Heliophilum fasciatum]TCP64171.1 ABC-type transport system involved in multi-copper enzyme maturation permease subunit [Heliophilum fasciatum]